MKPATLEDKVAQYISCSLFWTEDTEHLTRMVILHFDLPDEEAKKMVQEYLKTKEA